MPRTAASCRATTSATISLPCNVVENEKKKKYDKRRIRLRFVRLWYYRKGSVYICIYEEYGLISKVSTRNMDSRALIILFVVNLPLLALFCTIFLNFNLQKNSHRLIIIRQTLFLFSLYIKLNNFTDRRPFFLTRTIYMYFGKLTVGIYIYIN